MGEDFESQFKQHHDSIAAYKQGMQKLFSEIGMPLPETLFRVHYLVPELVFDQQGLIIPQIQLAFPELHEDNSLRYIPMIHWDDMNLVSRYFAFPEFKKSGKNFLLLAIDTWKVQDLSPNPDAPLLKHGEYFGKVSQSAIKEVATFTWKRDGSKIPEYLAKLNREPINMSEGYIAVKVK